MSAVAIIFALITLGSGLTLGVVYFRRNRRAVPDPSYHTRCIYCKRRFRYFRRQIGHKGMCPRCRRPLTFPAPEPDQVEESVHSR